MQAGVVVTQKSASWLVPGGSLICVSPLQAASRLCLVVCWLVCVPQFAVTVVP